MKKSLFISVLALGLLASCGGEPANSTPTSQGGATSSKTSTPKSSSEKHVHTFDETKWEADDEQHWHPATCGHSTQKGSATAHKLVADNTKSVAATCEAPGKEVKKCSDCGKEVETILPKLAHTWGTASEEVRPEGKTGYKTRECTKCHTKDLIVNALQWTKKEGDNKDSTGATLKFSANGNYAEYEFDVPAAMTNATVALYGYVDYWKDGSNNNDQRGFFSGKNGDAENGNFEIKLNGTAVAITNHSTYEGMGMTEGENGNSSFHLCEVGTVASVAAGAMKITYTRVDSFNLNITEIHFLYK